MNVQDQIAAYIASQPEPKRSDMQALHDRILQVMPGCRLWFLDGRNDAGEIVSNPNIGYGIGIEDKKYLAQAYGDKLGKASVTGYCIKFKALKDIDPDVLEAAIRFGAARN